MITDEFIVYESSRTDDRSWYKWIAELESKVGNVDGDQDRDGYSLDECYDWFEEDVSVSDAAIRINKQKQF